MLAAIVLTLGVPGFRTLVQDNRMTAHLNTLSGDLAFARSEAIKRGADVTVCSANAGIDQCSGSDDWSSGWIAFLDVNDNSTVDNDEDVLRVGNAAATGSDLTYGGNLIRYSSRGFATGFNGTFLFCDGRGVSHARLRVLANSGRLRAADPDPDDQSCPCDDAGTCT